LLELLIRVQTKPRFTAAELAEEFGVSRRTMLRDLGALSAMGVPLRSTPGPGGGYSLPRGGRRLSPSLSVDEALALIASYEALLRRYPVHPFSTKSLSAVTKLRAALPKDVVVELDKLRRHVLVDGPVRDYEAPLLGELLEAAIDGSEVSSTGVTRLGPPLSTSTPIHASFPITLSTIAGTAVSSEKSPGRGRVLVSARTRSPRALSATSRSSDATA
jgi:biotin operon repressor